MATASARGGIDLGGTKIEAVVVDAPRKSWGPNYLRLGVKVSEGQPVMELETDKAVVEVPSSVSGVVKEVKVKEGEKIKVGQVIFTLEGGAAPAERARPRTCSPSRRSP